MDGTTKRYRVRGIDIRHNGRLIHEGQTIDLIDIEADRLADYLAAIDDASNDKPQKTSSRKLTKGGHDNA